MKYTTIILTVLIVIASVTPGVCFVNYLFGGSSDNAIGNSALGELRSWWTGNPVYQFDPFYQSRGVPNQVVEQAPPSSLNAPSRGGTVVQYGPGGYQYQSSVPYNQGAPSGGYAPQQAYPSQAPQGYQPQAQYGPPQAQPYQAPAAQQYPQQYQQQYPQQVQQQGYPANMGYR